MLQNGLYTVQERTPLETEGVCRWIVCNKKEDVIHLVLQAWADLIACKTSNQNAIAERGAMDATVHPESLTMCIRGDSSGQISEALIGQEEVLRQDEGDKNSIVPSSTSKKDCVAAELNLSQGLSG